MGITDFHIELLKTPARIYTPGEWIEGNLILCLDKPTKVKAIKLQFFGGAFVYWTESDGDDGTHSYNNQETYFDTLVHIWPSDQREQFHSGIETIYPFKFELPCNLPPSFEEPQGNVSYWVEAKLKIPGKSEKKSRMAFAVNAVRNLNHIPSIMEPRRAQVSQSVGCLCCVDGTVENTLMLERGSYVPGEYIVIKGEVDNKSDATMKSSSIIVRRIVTFVSTIKPCVVEQRIQRIKRGKIKAGCKEDWSGERFLLGDFPPSGLDHCNIIDVQYYVTLFTKTPGTSSDVEASCEFTIGTIPFQSPTDNASYIS